MKLPQGYKQAPSDYVGEIYLESQMRWIYDQGYDDGFIVGSEKGRDLSEEIKAAKREALLEAANEIERLRDEIAVEEKRFSAQWEILAASQARETKLREFASRMAGNVSAIVFVYRHRETGEIKAQYINDPEPGEDWTHIETLDPAPWIAAHFDGRISSPKTTID